MKVKNEIEEWLVIINDIKVIIFRAFENTFKIGLCNVPKPTFWNISLNENEKLSLLTKITTKEIFCALKA